MSEADQVRYGKDGKPFKSEEIAAKFIADNNMSDDTWGIYPSDGGFGVMTFKEIAKRQRAQREAEKNAQASSEEPMEYWVIKFSAKGHQNDLNKVPVGVNGKILYVSRGIEVVLPQNYLDVIDSACQTDWQDSPDPTQAVVAAGTIKRYPYEKVKKSSQADFDKMLEKGNAITWKAVESAKNKQ